jgi:hypothetical protein
MDSLVTKRSYNRRSEEDQIRELQEKVAELKAQAEAKARKEQPVVREWPKVQKALRAFAQIAMENKREDLAISAQAFMAGIERTLDPEVGASRGRRRDKDKDDEGGWAT